MKKTLIILISFVLISCSSSENHADYEKNLEIAKKFISLHSSEDWEAQAELIHDDLSWSQPVYGSENYGKEGHIEAMKMYQSMFDNIKFEADYWLNPLSPKIQKQVHHWNERRSSPPILITYGDMDWCSH